jgi:hypothetical protein
MSFLRNELHDAAMDVLEEVRIFVSNILCFTDVTLFNQVEKRLEDDAVNMEEDDMRKKVSSTYIYVYDSICLYYIHFM